MHNKQLVFDVHLTQFDILQDDNSGLQLTPWLSYDEYPAMQFLQIAALLHEKQFEINELHRLHTPSIRNELEAHCWHSFLFVIEFNPHFTQLELIVKHETHVLLMRR